MHIQEIIEECKKELMEIGKTTFNDKEITLDEIRTIHEYSIPLGLDIEQCIYEYFINLIKEGV